MILGKVLSYLLTTNEDPKIEKELKFIEALKLKAFLLPFTENDPTKLVDLELDGFKPFKYIDADKLVRFSDEEWAKSMLDDSTEFVSCDCPCEIAVFKDKIWLRWTLPGKEALLGCWSESKLVYMAMVVAEELMHLGQIVSLDETQVVSLESTIEVNHSVMGRDDIQKLATIRESDVTEMFSRILGEFPKLQWFSDRNKVVDNDIHQVLSLEEVVRVAMDICEEYGYPEEFLSQVVEEVTFLNQSNSNALKQLENDPIFHKMREVYQV